jgi:hypothetical protein
MTYMGTSIEALRTVAGVKKEGLVLLNEGDLMAQTLDLGGRVR